ncbi:MAG TPA: ATP-binding protein [Actinomycetes bacterium]
MSSSLKPPVVSEAPSLRGVSVVLAGGRLDDTGADLQQNVLQALADSPRAVLCDLGAVTAGSDAAVRDLVAGVGQQVQDWPAVPIAISCLEADLRHRLREEPLSRLLSVRATARLAMDSVAGAARPPSARLDLDAVPAASRHARDLARRTLLDWGMTQLFASAALVVSELVANAVVHAGTPLRVTLGRHDGAVRLAVRDGSPEPVRRRMPGFDRENGRGLYLVEACARAWGVLPTVQGGKVVWVVLGS